MPYQIHVYNSGNASRADILVNATDVEFTRTNSGTREIRFAIPRDDAQISLLTHGTVVRAYETETETDHAVGQIAGVISLGPQGFVRYEAEGLSARLADTEFPADYVLSGDISSVENTKRLTQSYDYRRITSTTPSDITHDANELCSWNGYLASANSSDYLLLSGAIVWDLIREDATEDATGTLTLAGASDDDGDGINEIPPYSGSGVYESPIYDWGSAVDDMDVLRFDGSYDEQEVKWSVETYIAIAGRSFPVAQFPTFPSGAGEDITGLLDRRYFAVRFEFSPNDATRKTPAIYWFEVIARRDIPGITQGTVVSQTVEDNFTVGGMTLLAVLDRIAESYGLEWRVRLTGEVDVQTEPATGAVGATWGTDRRDTYHLIEGHHVNITAYDRDDEDLVNYLVATGTGAGGNAITVVLQDATSQGDYGLRQKTVAFNVDTMTELKTEADAYLAANKDPRESMVLDVYDTPDGLMSFAPGDLVSVSSFLNTDHDGNDIAKDFRILEENRRATDGGVRVRLRLENKPKPFLEDLGVQLAGLKNAVADSIERTQQGVNITPERTTSSIYDEDVLLDFTPSEESSGAVILQIEDTTSGLFYSPEESLTVVRIVDIRVLERTLTIRYERTSGTHKYKAHINWWASGRIYRPSRVG
jgi:hypothetical protein